MGLTLTQVVISVAVVALLLTTILKYTTDRIKQFILSFLQNFCGILFMFSGAVKAVDPLGTAYKLEQYFGEFQATFDGTWFDFLTGLFPLLSEYAVGFSVFMIVLEIVIGIMLVIGAKAKWTAWIFLLLIIFFTFLTGFTYLTGYVPSTANFFDFGQWVPYQPTNMKVTDCGCFGDFLVIEPKISFLKDIVLLFPALIFVFKSKDMHMLFSKTTRNVIVGISTLALIWYCLSNFSWDIPHADFRPFREGVNIRDQRQAELDAESNVEVVGFLLKNLASGKMVELSAKVYLAEMTSTYNKKEWKVAEHIKTEPAIKSTKLSEFAITDEDGYDVADEILDHEGYQFWIVSYKVPYAISYEKVISWDTLFTIDTVIMNDTGEQDIIKSFGKPEKKEDQRAMYNFDEKYLRDFSKELTGLVKDSGIPMVGFFGGMDAVSMAALQQQLDLKMKMYEADDILLKTIVRSNPGLVLMKDGVVVKKWHKENLPTLNQLKELTGSSSNN